MCTPPFNREDDDARLRAFVTGLARTHEDPAWLRGAVTDLTDRHKGPRDHAWEVGDAPDAFVEGQLRGIVGVELAVTRVEGKAKLSQNRSAPDRQGVIDGLRGEPRPGSHAVAAAMTAAGDD